jgi:lipopolysaccharide transport system ATP-binding protein
LGDTVISIENICKVYRLGEVGTGTLSHDIRKWWFSVRGKKNPYEKIAEVNYRDRKADTDYVYALKDINYEVKQGDVLGVIGKNGAGKSTLLKILAKTTSPTSGLIKIKGKIASLLEVGTGFHPDLTGRENVYLNGSILGMTRAEIAKKFDELVAFSGVERYIDTPVKRYSSGMTVRLAFSVAAHLEPDILIVDEVLAVGDAEFQKKCIGKMQDVSSVNGRTVLFVSHNMTAITNLCAKGLYLSNGQVAFTGTANEAVAHYLKDNLNQSATSFDFSEIQQRGGGGKLMMQSLLIKNGAGETVESVGIAEPFSFLLKFKSNHDERGFVRVIIGVYNEFDDPVARFDSFVSNNESLFLQGKEAEAVCDVEGLHLVPGMYFLNIALYLNDVLEDYLQYKCSFEITDNDYFNTGKNFPVDLTKTLARHKWVIR